MKISFLILIPIIFFSCSASDIEVEEEISKCIPQSLIVYNEANLGFPYYRNDVKILSDSFYFYVVESFSNPYRSHIEMFDHDLNRVASQVINEFTVDDVSLGKIVGSVSDGPGISLNETVEYKSVDMLSGDQNIFHEVDLNVYRFAPFQSIEGKYY